MVLRGKLVTRVLQDYRTFSSRVVFVPKDTAGAAFRAIPITAALPAHKAFRSLVTADMTPARVKSREGTIRSLAVQLIESFRLKGCCNFTHDLAEQMPLRIFMEMVNLPFSDAPRLKVLVDQYTRPKPGVTYDQVWHQLAEYLQPLIDERRGKAGTDMCSHIINGQVDGRELTNKETLSMTFNVLIAGLDTVVNYIGGNVIGVSPFSLI
jgi:camphor 5-monooxygenase